MKREFIKKKIILKEKFFSNINSLVMKTAVNDY